MDLFEFQALRLLHGHQVPISTGQLARSPEQARTIAENYGQPVMVKAQVKVGGRGKVGGVKYAATPQEAQKYAGDIIGMDIKGHIARAVLISPAVSIEQEYYISFVVDRSQRSYMALCSAQGGMDVEELASQFPEKLARIPIDPYRGVDEEVARRIIHEGALPNQYESILIPIIIALWDVFITEDASLVEINPLVLTRDQQILCVDAKITLDDNAAFRHRGLIDSEDEADVHPLELRARALELNYVKLNGQVGVIGNGAGLVMSTLDVVALAGLKHGGIAPANFLDIGGGASAIVMAKSLRLILSDNQVKSVFVNIFGGITACDEVASGIVQALDMIHVDTASPELGLTISEENINIPIVVRLDGHRMEEGRKILEASRNPQIIIMSNMDEAADKATELALR